MGRKKATQPDRRHNFTDASTPPSFSNRKRTGRMVSCPICGTEVYRSGSEIASGRRQACSLACGYKLRQLPRPTNWRGDECSYDSLHQWVKRHKGKPSRCDKCGTTERRIEWANISGDYRRDLNDWRPLCVPCHRRSDAAHPANARELFEVRANGSLGKRRPT